MAKADNRQLVNTVSGLASHYSYDAYGQTQTNTSSAVGTNTKLYCGEQWDSTLNMYNLRARYYDPANGRFNQRDAFAGNHDDPQSLHKYAYANCEPIERSDPSGNLSVIELIITVAIGLILTAQYLNAPGLNDQNLPENAAAEVVIAFMQWELLAAPLQSMAKLVVGLAGRAVLWLGRYRGYQFGAIWENVIVHHATGAAASVLRGIDLRFVSAESRFGRAFYVAEEGGTAIAEAVNATQVIRFDMNLNGFAVLDFTDPAVAQGWGYVESAGREATQALGQRAVDEGYTAIKFYSVEVPGTVNYAIFGDFEQVLAPREVLTVPW